ncbi:dephospho-CoA kinase [Wenzhouxiangella marina]|uniref:Dephospho-CoA kinase n=1 Tax=Wenzhouxiangella marina TaxID=1579979 RepID=A0A0K0XWG8_9GAMM|nr:dephospho-CoA kinase [Wenzhouxiangella marina]AKS42015.1 dephospho-CoA kinase [Wenzhouxiangella marina]MBB6086217.1 dephospho-CoA kinase [Wenzhouxiangella marina]
MQNLTTGRPYLVALTGGIASGKTAVSDGLAARGAVIIDTDLLAREVVQPGSIGLERIVDVFGEDILQANGALDRRALRQRIFDSPAARQQLEQITHPLIEQRVRERIRQAGRSELVVLVVPLLVETGLFDDVDEVLVVDVPREVQIERLTARDGISIEQAEQILAAQASREERLARADQVIENDGSLADLEDRIDRYFDRLKRRSERKLRLVR